MGAAIRDLVGYERLGMRLTYQESIEPEPTDLPPWSHQYERGVDVLMIDRRSTSMAGAVWSPRAADLARFFRALLRGEVFDDPATLATMTRRLQDMPALRPPGHGRRSRRRRHVPVPCLGRAIASGGVTTAGGAPRPTPVPTRDLTVVAGHQQPDMPRDFDRMTVLPEVLALLDAD